MTFGILIFPGAHGDKELIRVIGQVYGKSVKPIWNSENNLNGIDVLFIPGGFTCKGSSNSSCIKDSPVIDSMIEFAERGKILVGIGNGFRLLCETDLVPGMLRMNKSQRFICKDTYIKPDNDSSVMTQRLSGDRAYCIPIATGYGRYSARDEVLVRMRYNEQILFRYCDQYARITESINYTGSVDNIAGVCNEKKNVIGIMPQPERAIFPYSRNTDGRHLFDSLLQYL